MASFIDSQLIDVPCGKCGRKVKKTIGWVNSNRQIRCACGTVTMLNTDKFKPGVAKANAAVKKLEDAIKALSKKR